MLQFMFRFISRAFVMMGSSINPFIYATTIPGFKAMLQNHLIRFRCMKGEVSQMTQTETSEKWSFSMPNFIRKKRLAPPQALTVSVKAPGDKQ